MKMQQLLLIGLLIAVSLLGCARAEPALTFARCELLVESDVAEVVFRKLMANLNINVDIRAFPPARATTENVSARVAGEIERIYSYGVKYPTLVRVTPSYYSQTSVVYAQKSRQLNISSKEDLKKYRVGVVRGVKHTDDLVEGLPTLVKAINTKNLIKMLLADRVDVIITTGIDGDVNLARLGATNDIKAVATLAKLELFIYLNQSSSAYRKRISKEIVRMRSSGELASLIAKTEARVSAVRVKEL